MIGLATVQGRGFAAFVPRGARAQYGLLGLRYLPASTEAPTVKVPAMVGTRGTWQGELAGPADEVHVGLSAEYADAVLEGLLESADRSPGTLEVIEAAHGLAGSSGAFFRTIVRAACAILWTADEDLKTPTASARLRQIIVHEARGDHAAR